MPKYDAETLLLSETYMTGVLMQIAMDSLAEVVELTGDASLLETFFQQILDRDWSDVVVAEGTVANPMRRKMALSLLKQRLPEAIGVMRQYAQMQEAQKSTRETN